MDEHEKHELHRLQRIAQGRDPLAFWGIAVIGAILTLINITSINMEARMHGAPSPGLTPWINEPTALLAILLLYPALRRLATRLPIPPERWLGFFGWHALAALFYSAAQYLLMNGFRLVLWPVITHRPYFMAGHVAYDFVYEMRKQVFIYAVILTSIYVVRALAEQARALRILREDARQSGKLSLQCGVRQIRIAASDFVHAEAAGNYAQVYTSTAHHLARTSLQALQEQLQAARIPAIRVHRAILVNGDCIVETAPAGSGDWEIIMNTGVRLRASRRYRHEFTTHKRAD